VDVVKRKRGRPRKVVRPAAVDVDVDVEVDAVGGKDKAAARTMTPPLP
jgi:hypothetical protein